MPHDVVLLCPQVLRFYAVWDDRSGLYGDRRPYVVHYYLEDDTVEINEVRALHTTVHVKCFEKNVVAWQVQAVTLIVCHRHIACRTGCCCLENDNQ